MKSTLSDAARLALVTGALTMSTATLAQSVFDRAKPRDPEPMIGEIREFPYNFCPRGWAHADGRLMEISKNTALFSLLGTQYGGDGRTTFALPDTRGRNIRHCIAIEGRFPMRS